MNHRPVGPGRAGVGVSSVRRLLPRPRWPAARRLLPGVELPAFPSRKTQVCGRCGAESGARRREDRWATHRGEDRRERGWAVGGWRVRIGPPSGPERRCGGTVSLRCALLGVWLVVFLRAFGLPLVRHSVIVVRCVPVPWCLVRVVTCGPGSLSAGHGECVEAVLLPYRGSGADCAGLDAAAMR